MSDLFGGADRVCRCSHERARHPEDGACTVRGRVYTYVETADCECTGYEAAAIPPVLPGQTWERRERGWWMQFVVVGPDGPRGGRHYVRVRAERGSSIRLDRFDGRSIRFVSGPTS